MHTSTILPTVRATLCKADFDPTNPAHVEAFVMLTQTGKQHPALRFTLEHPFVDVRAMMFDKIGRAYANLILTQSNNTI